jgi:hypothetical protein
MSDPLPHKAATSGRGNGDHRPRLYLICALAFISTCALTATSLAICGPSLAIFIAGLFFLTPLLPPLALSQSTSTSRLVVAGCAADGVAILWLLALLSPEITLLQWLKCYLILLAYSITLVGVATALLRLHLPEFAASAITVVCSLIWLSWPVWLSPYLTGPHADSLVAWLTWLHPLFAINGVLAHLGAWSHWPIAYQQLTTLGQDIPYTFPSTIWPTISLHLILGVGLVTWASGPCKRLK